MISLCQLFLTKDYSPMLCGLCSLAGEANAEMVVPAVGVKVNFGIIVQLSKDIMDWVSRRLCYAVGDTDRSVSWTLVYSLIRMTCPGGDGVCTHVNSRNCLLYTSPSPRDLSTSRMPSSA